MHATPITTVASWVVAVALCLSGSASADCPNNADAECPRDELERSRDWKKYPRPDRSDGIAVHADDSQSAAIWIPRALLLVPRAALEVVSAPVRGGLWIVDRYNLPERITQLFFNDAGTLGIYPTALIADGFGLSVGATLIHKDLLGGRERLRARASYGGRYRQAYRLSVDSGDRLGDRLAIALAAGYEGRPRERFFGIGNADVVDADSGTAIDPTQDDTAVATRFRDDRVETGGTTDLRLVGNLHLDWTGMWERRRFGESDQMSGDESLEDVYDPAAVVGYRDAIHSVYNEGRLRYDSRRGSNEFASAAMPGAGLLVAGHVGYNHLIGEEHRGHFCYGGDLQLYIDVYSGSRVLGLRLLAEQVHAELDQIPFIFLPSLGGDQLLRGYPGNRFRDRALTMASVEYKWELFPRFGAAYVFSDVGRVQRSLMDPDFTHPRIGYGLGLQLHTMQSFLMRMDVSSSIDGGLFFNLDFNPVIDARVREVGSQ